MADASGLEGQFVKYVKSFLTFLWDFFIGDTPELFVGACVAVFAAWLVHREITSLSQVVLPVSVALVMAWSLRRSQKR